jgi:predicted nucleic acid-binding protein
MAPVSTLLDSSFLFELLNQNDIKHPIAYTFAKRFKGRFVVSEVTLTEVAFLFNRDGGVPAVVRFLDQLVRLQAQMEPLTYRDLIRARQIMNLYADSKLDFVDCCLMALSERLKITQICTFDTRDFMIFHPQYVDHLEILP